MRLGGQMEDCIRAEVSEGAVHRCLVADVCLQKGEAGVGGGECGWIEANLLEGLWHASVGEFVDHEDVGFSLLDQEPDEGRADKPGAASDDATFRICQRLKSFRVVCLDEEIIMLYVDLQMLKRIAELVKNMDCLLDFFF